MVVFTSLLKRSNFAACRGLRWHQQQLRITIQHVGESGRIVGFLVDAETSCGEQSGDISLPMNKLPSDIRVEPGCELSGDLV